jgi:hypothetical protein
MSVARRFAAALAIVGAGVLAYAVPASATGDKSPGHECAAAGSAGAVRSNLVVDSIRERVATATVHARKAFCDDVRVILSTYTVPEKWTEKDGWSAAAAPQDIYGNDVAQLDGTEAVTLTAKVKDCGSMQTDLYWWGPEGVVEKVTYPQGHGDAYVDGGLWSNKDETGRVKACTPSPSPSPSPSTSVPTPPAEGRTPVTPPTQPVAGPVVKVPAPPVAAAPPQLAQTGSDSTLPVLGLGVLLLGAGIGLNLLGRRRST